MLDVAGVDVSSAPLVVSSIKTVVNAARQASVPIVYVVEALGATLQRITDDQAPTIHWPRPARLGELPAGLHAPEEAAKTGRVPVAVEVIRRMKALPNRDFLLMAGVTGPLTLATRITQLEHKETLRSEDLSDAAQELAASVVTQMASAFLEAGAEMIIVQEEIVPALSVESCDTWANLLAPTINVVRFYEALPLLHLRPGIVTTFGDVPITTDMKHLIKVFEGVRRAV